MSDPLDLGHIWEWFAETSCKGYSPIYDRICRFVAHDDDLLALVKEAPPPAHQPNVLLGVVASAGLNLGCDRYLLDYGPAGTSGPADAAVRIECTVRGGRPPIAPRLPEIAARLGLDRSPIDLTDERDARWMLACIWP